MTLRRRDHRSDEAADSSDATITTRGGGGAGHGFRRAHRLWDQTVSTDCHCHPTLTGSARQLHSLAQGTLNLKKLSSNHVLSTASTLPRTGLYCHHHLWLASANSTFLQCTRAAMPHRNTMTQRCNAMTVTWCYNATTATWHRNATTATWCRDATTVTRRHDTTSTTATWCRDATIATRCVALRQRHGAWCYSPGYSSTTVVCLGTVALW
ncbi:hypothetical protein EDB84DRAFT_1442493 [Lactarius hengduanensis]|nr:hypothetical protein EDB84DRAFT_1442493 [Lactarius hengduanensis]